MQPTQRRILIFKLALGGSLLLILFSVGIAFMPLGHSTAQDTTMTPTITPAPRLELNEERIKRATVFIMQTYERQGQQIISCVGSGSLVSSDGLILTNAHIALPSEICRSDRIIISITVNLDEPPIPTYTAEIVDSSQGLDLAVLRINGYLDGREIEPGTLQLPFVELGDSLTVELDDTITVVGYADFGNAPVETRRGTISGFTAEARAGDRAWIRTSASIPGTISGGGAYNRDGRLIGIPTIAPARAAGEILNCRVIQDTNADGRADDNDRCVPVGGFISALRPSRLARGLVRAAALNIQQGGDLTPDIPVTSEAQPVFRRLFFTTRINEAGVPANVVGSVPTGTESLYLFFDYANMVDGMVYELRVTIDDVPNATYSLPPITWSGGANGTWYIGSAGIPWPNGEYNFRLFIEGRETASKRITIGGGPTFEPQFTDIVFGVLDESANLAGTSYVQPEGAAIQARFNYRNMQPDNSWSYIWYFNGQELLRDTLPWEGDSQGTFVMPASGEFFPGPYRLELYINNALSASADFVVAGGAEAYSTQIFSGFEFTDAQIAGIPTGTIRSDFPERPSELYVFFDWRLLAPGTPWTRRWLVDGDPLFEITEPWDADATGENYYVGLRSIDLLPDATYTFEIILANVVQASEEAKVGLGQLRAEEFESAEGVQMTGRITDAETGKGIPGAIFIVLESEYSVEDFLWEEEQVLGFSLADSDGYFQIEEVLERGTLEEDILYSVVVRAEGYLPVDADGISVGINTESPVVINVEMSRN